MEPDLTIESFRAQEAASPQEDRLVRVFSAEKDSPRQALYSDSTDYALSFDVVRIQKASLRKALHTYKETLRCRDSKEARAFLESLEGCEDFTTLNQRLMDARQQWLEKKRLFGGKAQEFFHKLCRTMGGHKTILNAFPESNEYMSIFCAAFNTIVQASLNHQKSSEQLLLHLEQINEAVEMAAGSVALFNIEATRNKFANLYGEVFNFFVKALKWYGASSSRKTADPSHSEKIIKSINSNYNEKFADVVKNILRLRSDIADRSSLGSMAEVRDIRVKTNATGEDVQAIRNALHEHSVAAEIQARAIAELDARNLGLRQEKTDYQRQIAELSDVLTRQQIGQGMARIFESMIQQNPNGTFQLALPATPLNPMIAAGTSYQTASASDRIKGTYEKETLQMYSEMLSDHVFGEDVIEPLLDIPPAVALPNEMFARLRDWISSDKSEILWVAGPDDHCYPSKMSAIAATMVKLFAEAKPMVVFHFCDLPNPRTIPDGKSMEEIGLISLVYSMIQQLIEHVPPQFDSSIDFGPKRFTPLDGNISTLDGALELFRDLITLCLPYIVFIVDGIERLDYRQGQQGCKEFVNTLRQLKTMKPRNDEPQCIYKVLFTTAGKPGALMQTLECREILLQDERRGSLNIDRMELGTAAFSELGNSC